MSQPRNSQLTGAETASQSSRQDSNRWTTLKSSLVLGLKATEMALDGLPIPGAKGCISLILHLIKTTDLTFGNAEAVEALQSRLEGLHEALSPVYANPDIDVPDDLSKGIRNLAVKLDKLASKWKQRLEKKQRKRDFILRMLTAEDDRDSLTTFANSVDQAIQDFLVVTITNGRIAAFGEDIKNREARTLHLLPRAPSASYNSARTGGANACLKGTRVSILKTIREWARNPNPDQPPMFWLNGLAGIGKTTIAHTIASELDAKGILGASFVFLRADDQLKDACLVFPTLAFQLAQFNSRFRTRLVEVLEHDPDCGSKRLDLQFAALILRPFSAIQLSAPVVVILDALDECEPEKLTSELLRILLKSIKRIPFLRIFVTSRPEGYIRKALDLIDSRSPHQKLVLHEDIHAEEAENDIRLFLRLRLQEIWNERTNQSSDRWPSKDNLEKLVKQSGRLFVYAATAVRFIGGNSALNLNRQLSTLLRVKIGHVPKSEPYQQLDGLYLQILDSVFPDSGDEYYTRRFRKIVGSIVLLERPLPLGSLANLLDCSSDDIKETLYHLHSIIIVPAALSEAPRTYHLSFPNFITNSNRCTSPKPYIDPSQQAKYLFGRCLSFLEKDFGPVLVNSLDKAVTQDARQLQPEDSNTVKQIAPLEEEPLTDSDECSARSHISLEDDIEDYNLAPEIRYSDNYWCRHLMNIPTGDQKTALALERFNQDVATNSKRFCDKAPRIYMYYFSLMLVLAICLEDVSTQKTLFTVSVLSSCLFIIITMTDVHVWVCVIAPAPAPSAALILVFVGVLAPVPSTALSLASAFPVVLAQEFPLALASSAAHDHNPTAAPSTALFPARTLSPGHNPAAFPVVLASKFPEFPVLTPAFPLALAPSSTAHDHNPAAAPSTLSPACARAPDHNPAAELVLAQAFAFALALAPSTTAHDHNQSAAAPTLHRAPDHNSTTELVLTLASALALASSTTAPDYNQSAAVPTLHRAPDHNSTAELVLTPASAFTLALAPSTAPDHNQSAAAPPPHRAPDHNSTAELVLALAFPLALAPSTTAPGHNQSPHRAPDHNPAAPSTAHGHHPAAASSTHARAPDHNPAAALILAFAFALPLAPSTVPSPTPGRNPAVALVLDQSGRYPTPESLRVYDRGQAQQGNWEARPV
ncbi:hypothetical protein D9619_011571 [Psilocybe cf. subviscida]|uniref:NACHT domain-containing protein n=1 Tax=Psilocybe cf. subviscida TaxID=2480587 RepID=A0A8H5FA68_9AGAR|nr:hypothetical protein D9619_011571 [Psilocybe cf. subviscida]